MYLGGAVSFTKYSNSNIISNSETEKKVYILGDQHLKTASQSKHECKAPNATGIEEWMNKMIQHTTHPIYILLEIDPLLSQTMVVENSWIASVNEALQPGNNCHIEHIDLRGQEMVKKFGNNPTGHVAINNFLSCLYDSPSVQQLSQLKQLTGDTWTKDKIIKQGQYLSKLVDEVVIQRINELLQRHSIKLTIIIFVGEKHARRYREWMENKFSSWEKSQQTNVDKTTSVDYYSKCLMVVN